MSHAIRGAGVGRSVLDALLQAARLRGDSEVVLHSQTGVTGFYGRAGFAPQGERFSRAGIEHIEMTRSL